MHPRLSDLPPPVRNFTPRQKPRDPGNAADEAGRALVALLQEAGRLSQESCERSRTAADQLSIQLREAEARIAELQAEAELFRGRAAAAEKWLLTIQSEIEARLIAPIAQRRADPAH
jgi:hypothetical protein